MLFCIERHKYTLRICAQILALIFYLDIKNHQQIPKYLSFLWEEREGRSVRLLTSFFSAISGRVYIPI